MTPTNAFEFVALSLVVKHLYEGQGSAAKPTSLNTSSVEKITYFIEF